MSRGPELALSLGIILAAVVIAATIVGDFTDCGKRFGSAVPG
jgi:hypothetical protein